MYSVDKSINGFEFVVDKNVIHICGASINPLKSDDAEF